MQALRQLLIIALSLPVFLGLAPLSPASAQGRLDAQYSVTLAGIPIGKGSWVLEIDDSQYSGAVNGTTTGLLRVLTGGHGTGTGRGTLQAGRFIASSYNATITTSKKNDQTRLTIDNGNLKDAKVEPPQDNDSERVPITEAHRRGIFDPLSASLLRVPGNGNPVSPTACQNTRAIFDGRLRYDLQMVFKRMDKVSADKGYAGPVVVCAIYFSPVAGFIPSRAAIKYISKQRDMEIWLAPIAGTRVLVPFRVQGPSPVGQVVLEADQFITTASAPRAAANGGKTQ